MLVSLLGVVFISLWVRSPTRAPRPPSVLELVSTLAEDRPFRPATVSRATGIELHRVEQANPYWSFFESDRDPERTVARLRLWIPNAPERSEESRLLLELAEEDCLPLAEVFETYGDVDRIYIPPPHGPPRPNHYVYRFDWGELSFVAPREQSACVTGVILETGPSGPGERRGERHGEVTMRASSWNLNEGFDKVRWGDDRESLAGVYPTAGERRRRAGVDPQTGQPIVVSAGLYVRSGEFAVPVAANGILLSLGIGLDERGVREITLGSDGGDERYESASADEWTNVIRTYAGEMAAALGLDPFDPNEMEQAWDIGGIRVTLLLEWDGFLFTFRPSD